MNALEALGDHGLDAKQCRAFGRPVTAGTCTVFDAAKDHQGRAVCLIGGSRIKDRGLRPVRPFGIATLNTIQHLVLDTDVGEGAAHHHLMVATTRPVGVELAYRHLTLDQILARRSGVLERTGRADVVGGDHVAQKR